jgi:hypothetical protein
MKESQPQIQSNKELICELHPALELKIARKAALEAELKTLTPEIEADRKNIAELPGLTEKIQKVRTMCGSRTGGWSLPCVMSD